MKEERGKLNNFLYFFKYYREQSEETLLNLLEETCNRLDAASKI